MMTNKAMKTMYLLVALVWIGLVGYSTWTMVEKVQESGGTNVHLAMAVAVGLICMLPTPAIAARVMQWIAGDSAAKQPKP
jgi:ABC-type uncharacterized transport system YnjBCD permease subunit